MGHQAIHAFRNLPSARLALTSILAVSAKFEGVSPLAKAVILGVQPFHLADQYTDSILYRIHELNNRDKHRALVLSTITIELTGLVYPGILNMFMGGLVAPPGPGQAVWEDMVLAGVPVVPGLEDPSTLDPTAHLTVDIAINEDPFGLLEWSQFFRVAMQWCYSELIEPLKSEIPGGDEGSGGGLTSVQ